MSLPYRDRVSLFREAIARMRSYTDGVTFFGSNGIMQAWLRAAASLIADAYLLGPALTRRFTLLAAKGDDLTAAALERGAAREGATRAQTMVVVQGFSANVSAITSAATDRIEVDDSSGFAASSSVRIRNGDGTVSEVATVIAIHTGTGPGGNDEVEVATLSNTYSPGTDDVDLLLRVTLPARTVLPSAEGVDFETLEAVTTGDTNPIFDGESTKLALADKVMAEATVEGESGNIEPRSITELDTPVSGIEAVFNPERGFGGEPEESDASLRERAINFPANANQETGAWLEGLARQASSDVLRLVLLESSAVRTVQARVIRRNMGSFTVAEMTAMEDFIEARARSHIFVELFNMPLTAVEVEAEVTLAPNTSLEEAWKAAAQDLSTFVDPRRWTEGQDVDEADLLSIVKASSGVQALTTSTFVPAADVSVAANSLPYFLRLSLRDADTGDTYNAELATSF